MKLDISVPEEELELVASWKNPPQGKKRILIPIERRAKYAVVVTCADPRFLEEQCRHFNRLYGTSKAVDGTITSNAFIFSMIGGGLRLLSDNGRNASFSRSLGMQLDEIEQMFHLAPGGEDRVDFWIKKHIDCKWCRMAKLDIVGRYERLRLCGQAMKMVLQPGLYNIRHGYHHYWPRTGKPKSYEIMIDDAISDLRMNEFLRVSATAAAVS